MKKIILLLFVFGLAVNGSDFEKPDNSYDIQDEIEVDQKRRDKKIWKSMVQVYLGFRKIAKNSLAILERVVDWAWSAEKYLAAVERLAGTACVVYKNIKETGNFKWYDFVGIIEHLEENVFQYTDYMLTDGIEQLKDSRKELNESRRLLFTDPFKAKEKMREIMKNDQSYNLYYAEVIGCGMHQGVANKYQYKSEVKRNLITTNAAAEAIAGCDIRNMNAGNKSAIAENTLQKNVKENGEISMVAMAEANVVNNRNKLFSEVSQNEQIKDAIRINAMMLIQKASVIDMVLLNKAGLVWSIERMGEELKRQQGQE